MIRAVDARFVSDGIFRRSDDSPCRTLSKAMGRCFAKFEWPFQNACVASYDASGRHPRRDSPSATRETK